MSLHPSLPVPLRACLRRPRGSAWVVFLLALGIGLPTAIFSVLDGVMLRGLPFPDGDRIVSFTTADGHDRPMPARDFLALRERQESLEALAAFRTYNSVVTRPGAGSKGLTATYVTGNLFRMLGVEPIFGRGFSPEDEDPKAPSVAVLSHDVWTRQFGAEPDVLGQTVILNREPMEIVGVMPPGFRFPIRQEAWAILRWQGRSWSSQPVFAIGKLAPDTGVGEALAELRLRSAAFDLERPLDGARAAHLRPYAEALLPGAIQRSLEVLLVGVLGILLVACINIANLRLAATQARSRELAIRRAVGARSTQILRQLVGESVLLALAGGALGIALAWGLVELAAGYFLSGSPLVRYFWIDVRLDVRTGLFAVGLACCCVLLGGLLPALTSLRPRGAGFGSRASGGRGSLRLARGLIAVQVALCLALVTGSMLLIESGRELLGRQPSFDPDRLLRAKITVHQAQLDTAETRVSFWNRFFEGLAQEPAIEAATVASGIPWRGFGTMPIRFD
ncbi:MAG: ABC transporter permease, partial [Holophagales bacterium]|nr:ABC transporter permease [Holophagales bacterium]